jgi:hypothetical protein
MAPPGRHLLAAALAAALLAGCGGGGGSAAPPDRPPETVDPAAKPPPGWTTTTNSLAGFTIAVPHGWQPAARGVATLLTSPDRAVTVAVTADRTDEALAAPAEAVARGTILDLPGFTELKVFRAVPFHGRYPGAEADGNGLRTANGLRQRFRSLLLRRDGVAQFSVLISANGKSHSPFAEQADAIARSIRGRPVQVS